MPRLFHRPPKYRLHKTTKQAVVSFFGKHIYLGPYGSQKSHQRYQEVLKDWEAARHQPSEQRQTDELPLEPAEKLVLSVTPNMLREKRLAGSPITISELIYVYRQHTHEYYRKNGEVTREAGAIDDALRLLRKHHATTYVAEFGPLALDELRHAMVRELDWSRKYINKQVNRIRAMFKWASSKEIVDAAVPVALQQLAGLKKGRTKARETERITQVDDAVIDATLLHLPPMVADMVRFQRLTSARPGEVCSLSPGDIDRSGEVWIYRPAEHKTEHFEKDRVVAIGPQAQAILKQYLGRLETDYCFSPAESERMRRALATARRTTPLSCGNRRGTNRKTSPKRSANDRYTTASYRRAIHRACDKAGVDKWSPNRIRHTASTEIRKRFGIDAARAVDGHGSTSTTEIYAELDLQKAIEVMREIG
ncbi:tyrosine-type recombinase/integrase [Aeoliella mucimassa]|uniref:Site-specific tyrosine recombinase XerC n=1 Tax=Aeoliella mucimassa TaxID=2527972 RepID=A0A518APV0_9BACT|nr:site-specific integrase [Aeoliella mucimassa]QDU56748.1 site-specific tyrosine recombinase XerC [Aeoliella mucimassa]